MLCQSCNQNEASVHLTKIINGEKTELYICEECAQKTGQIPFAAQDPFSFKNLLSGILNPGIDSSFNKQKVALKCEKCGLSYQEFTQKGLFACAACYQAFNANLEPLLKRMHGSSEHNGKVPKRRGGALRVKRKIAELREELQREIQVENFERAAELRDEIHALEDNLGGE